MDWLINGWVWIAVAAIVMLVEVLLPGWAFVSLGLAMAAIGVALLLGWAPPFAIALLATAIASAIIWGVFWKVFPQSRSRTKIWTHDINEPPSTLR